MGEHLSGDDARARRLALGWSMQELATRANVPRIAVSALERGSTTLAPMLVDRVRVALDHGRPDPTACIAERHALAVAALIEQAAREAAAFEREECARICQGIAASVPEGARKALALRCVGEIRARGGAR